MARFFGWHGAGILFVVGLTVGLGAAPAERLAFKRAGDEAFQFDTGVLRGHLGSPGRGNGLSAVTHRPTGVALDRGARGYGLFSHYRVFSNHQRHGHGAWDWPRTSRLLDDGTVELRWPATAERPFAMRAVYRWHAPDTLDLVTEVAPQRDLAAFEVFLASYFSPAFSNALVYTQTPTGTALPGAFLAADQAHGVWQMFPRDAAARAIINDGRWKLPPNPVAWQLRPLLQSPIAVRRAPASGVTVVLMAAPGDCFAIATPHQTEGHYSIYFSLGGADLRPRQTVQFRSRLWVARNPSDTAILAQYQQWIAELRRSPARAVKH